MLFLRFHMFREIAEVLEKKVIITFIKNIYLFRQIKNYNH